MKFELNQKKKFGVERIFRFKDKYTLLVIIKNSKERKEYLLDLMAIDPGRHLQTIFAFKSLLSCIFFLGASAAIYFTHVFAVFNLPYQAWVLTALAVLVVISFMFFILLSRRDYIFVSRETKTPLVYFYNNFPSKKEFKLFTQYIQKESQLRFEKLKLDEQKVRAGEMKTIRRVFDEGVLSRSEYEKAKAQLLSMSN